MGQSLEDKVKRKVLEYLGISRPAGRGPALSRAQGWGACAVAIGVAAAVWILLTALL